MANYVVSTENLQSVAAAIRTKGGTSGLLEFPTGFNTAIGNIPTKQTVEWHQCPEAPRNFIKQIKYTGNTTIAYTPIISGTLTWSTSNSGIATVSGTNTGATITAVGVGSTTITASNGINTETVSVTIKNVGNALYISAITSYAPDPAVPSSNTKPIGETVDDVTYYNEVPNAYTPFSSTNTAGTLKPLDSLRWLNTSTRNVRDLGGWACDGGTVKYGKLFRGGVLENSNDRSIFVDKCNVRAEMDLRGSDEGYSHTESPLGADIKFKILSNAPSTYLWYANAFTESHREYVKETFRFIFDNVIYGTPVYFHCTSGADRTGTVACLIEGLLGVSQIDIDKDYELTCFYTTLESPAIRHRNESQWVGLISKINELSGTDFRDKCVTFFASLGFTADEINAFRSAMISGNPETVTPAISTFEIDTEGVSSNVTIDNTPDSIAEFQPYIANISAKSGYVINSITVTMGGTDITSSCFTGQLTPFGILNITENGEYLTDWNAKVNVNVESGATKFDITRTLGDSSSNNDLTKAAENEGYGETVTPDNGYNISSITVTMGGEDITSSAVTLTN